MVLDDDWGIRRGVCDVGRDSDAIGLPVEETAGAGRPRRYVLDEDGRNALFPGTADGADDVFQRVSRVPQGQLSAGEIIVLDVDDDQGFPVCCFHGFRYFLNQCL